MQVMSSRATYKIERKKINKTQTYTVYRDLIVTYKIKSRGNKNGKKQIIDEENAESKKKCDTKKQKRISFPCQNVLQ